MKICWFTNIYENQCFLYEIPYFYRHFPGLVAPIGQSEGFPLTGYFVPACVGRWAWPGQTNCRRVAVGVIFLSARFAREKLHKTMFSILA